MILTKNGTGYPSMLDRFKLPDHTPVSMHFESNKKSKTDQLFLEFVYDPSKQPDHMVPCKRARTEPEPETEEYISSTGWHYWINRPRLKLFPNKTDFLDTIQSHLPNKTSAEDAVHPLIITLLETCPAKFLTVRFPKPKLPQGEQNVQQRPDKEYNIYDAKDIITDIIAGLIPLSWASDPSFIIGETELNYYHKAHVVAYFNGQLIHMGPNEAWMKARTETCKTLDNRELSNSDDLHLAKFISEAKTIDDLPMVNLMQQRVKYICNNVIENQIKAITENSILSKSVNESNNTDSESLTMVDYKVEIGELTFDERASILEQKKIQEKISVLEKKCLRLPLNYRRNSKMNPKHGATLQTVVQPLQNRQMTARKKFRQLERQAAAKKFEKKKAERRKRKNKSKDRNDETVSNRFYRQFDTVQLRSAYSTYLLNQATSLNWHQ